MAGRNSVGPDPSAAGPVARLTDVDHRYKDVVALDGIAIEIPAGQIVGLIGPDGVGKSTLLGLIAGARKIQSGRVEALGGDMADRMHRARACADIAYMAQGLGTNLYPDLSVFENIDVFGRLFGLSRAERRQRIAELLAATGLTPFADRRAANLSGGMKQKLGLCCALIHEPALLILDEPTTGIDPLSRRQFWQLVDTMRARRPGMSVIVATAYMDEADGFDWLAAIHDGRVLATGAPQDLKTRTGRDNLEDAFVDLLPQALRPSGVAPTAPGPAAGAAATAIEAHGLTRRFGDFTAVDDVSFRIRQGEIFGFLGSNGCGKTTTMKMLTGLLPATEGSAEIFGHAVDPCDLETRKRVGFMSQAFSLYGELTVLQNLELHARLFHLPTHRIADRVAAMIERFGLADYRDQRAQKLPLGIRQRLSLAVAVIHEPELLILDEPTSGVDPVARDRFWDLLLHLSRQEGVTIFISTHFMNEAERCDRISLMHAGRVLAQGTPGELIERRGAADLEDAFIAYLEEAAEEAAPSRPPPESESKDGGRRRDAPRSPRRPAFSLGAAWAYARREATELRRDPIRQAFALLGPLLLMAVLGYGVSFDVEDIAYAALDRDRTTESRAYLDKFVGSRYFQEEPPIRDYADMDRRLAGGALRVAIEVPPNFGADIKSGRSPEVGIWLDGAMPFQAETSRGYVEGLHRTYLDRLAEAQGTPRPEPPVRLESRYRYNQDFQSVVGMVPGIVMLLLILIPSMMTAVGVVREKEMGSISNLYATPVTGLEFLVGKQLPYVALAMINFISLVLLADFLFGVSVNGSVAALTVGALTYVTAATGIGLLFSTFVGTQIAAIFGTAIVTTVPALQFSGLLGPVSSLTGGAKATSLVFPSGYFQQISLGAFAKELNFADLYQSQLVLAGFAILFLGIAWLLLKTQEE